MKKSVVSMLTAALVTPAIALSCTAKDFTDVPSDAWYYSDIQIAVEKGLISGKSENSYAPSDNLTYGEAVKLAACMHKLSTDGNTDFLPSDPWYMTFVEYAKENSIIAQDYDWTKNITRAEYLDIFSRALPTEQLNEINTIPDNSIPDVPITYPNANSVYKMYRAGIVQGTDGQCSCKPSENIMRSEAAAILNRMMDTSKRKSFTVVDAAEGESYYNDGITALNNGSFITAANKFTQAGNFKDAAEMVKECYYRHGKEQILRNYKDEGLKYLAKCAGYKDTDDILLSYKYEDAKKLFDEYMDTGKMFGANYSEAYDAVMEALKECKGYGNSEELIFTLEKDRELRYSAKKAYDMIEEGRAGVKTKPTGIDHIEAFKTKYEDGVISLSEKKELTTTTIDHKRSIINERHVANSYVIIKMDKDKSYLTASLNHIAANSPWNSTSTDIIRDIIAMFTERYEDEELQKYLKMGKWKERKEDYINEFNYEGYNFVIVSDKEAGLVGKSFTIEATKIAE